MNNHTAYLAPTGFTRLLIQELSDVVFVYDRLVVAKGAPQVAHWSQNTWYNPRLMPIRSIGHAAESLRAIQRNWWPYEFQYFGRMRLIQDKLPYISAKPLDFLAKPPASKLGSWTLIDENTILAASDCSSPMPNGEWIFREDKINPPSRAYLKLWEFFTRVQVYPHKNESCLDLGACPGGWTWVLAQLAKQVIACDKSPLDSRIMAFPNVVFTTRDAFKIKLAEFPNVSWVFSDVICYPQKLYDFVKVLIEEFPDKKYVFTIKFQGSDSQEEIIRKFSQLPGNIMHLSQNKHELTWFKI
jgi:23S rRNA (cytidine2498-2'-O)-methyltransferase